MECVAMSMREPAAPPAPAAVAAPAPTAFAVRAGASNKALDHSGWVMGQQRPVAAPTKHADPRELLVVHRPSVQSLATADMRGMLGKAKVTDAAHNADLAALLNGGGPQAMQRGRAEADIGFTHGKSSGLR